MKINPCILLLVTMVINIEQVNSQIHPEAWTIKYGTVLYREESFVSDGSYALRVKLQSINYTTPCLSSYEIPVTPGETFEFSYKYYVSNEMEILEVLEWTGASDQNIGIQRGGSGTMQYTEVNFSGIVPEGATAVCLGFIIRECEACYFDPEIHFGYLDNVRFQLQSDSENQMVNGGFENWIDWTWGEILDFEPEGADGIYCVENYNVYAVVGCPNDGTDSDGNNYLSNAGAVYILQQNQGGTDKWGVIKKIVPDDRHAGDKFGGSVDIYNKYIVVGAGGNAYDASGNNYLSGAGAIYMFSKDLGGTDNWGQEIKIVPGDRHASDSYGGEVKIDGYYSSGWKYYIAAGATGHDFDASGANELTDAGAVYLYLKDEGGSNTWDLVKKIVPPTRYQYDLFGDVLSLVGEYLAVGTPSHDYDASESNGMQNAGAVYLFHKDKDGTNAWGLEQKLVPEHRYSSDLFGFDIVLSTYTYGFSTEKLLLVGAYGHDFDVSESNYIDAAGAAYLFRKENGTGWTQAAKYVSAERKNSSYFGSSVAFFDSYIAIGEMKYQGYGALHFYYNNNVGTNTWELKKTIFAMNPVYNSQFGRDICISYSHAICRSKDHVYILDLIIPPGILKYSDIHDDEFTNHWTAGNNYWLSGRSNTVFVSSDTTGIAIPEDKTAYTASSIFGNGTQVNTSGWYCVYTGDGNSVTVTGLNPDTKYRTSVIMYLDYSDDEKYYLAEGENNPSNQVTGIDLQPVGLHVANNLITGTTSSMEYSMNSTDGTDGDWTACSEPNTSVNFSAGNVYLRQGSIPTNYRLLANIAPPPAAPVFTIDFPGEKTEESIPDTIEYNDDGDFNSPNLYGTGIPVNVNPGTDLYFRIMGTASTLPSEILTLQVPDRPAATEYSVDFDLETTTEVISNEDEYSISPDMDAAISGEWLKISLEPGQDLYFRVKVTDTTFSGEIQHLVVPLRSSVPVVSLSDKNSETARFKKSADGSGEDVTVADGLEYSENFGINWNPITPVVTVNATGINHITVRKRATAVSFASEPTLNLDYETPEVTVVNTESCNGPNDSVILKSNLDNGKVYLVHEDEPQSTVSDLDLAIISGKGVSKNVSTLNANIFVPANDLPAGTYYAYASNDWDSISAKSEDAITIYAIPQVDLGDDIIKCESTEVTLDPGTDFAYYSWSYNSATTRSVQVADENDYILAVTDDHGCQNSDTVSVRFNIPYQEEQICIVTIDLTSGKNVVVWEKTPDVGIMAYNIYRESTIGVYNHIGTIPYDDLSVFKDTTCNPESQSYLYKITTIDSCGNESLLANSKYHRPSFLQWVSSEGGVNLEWTDYNIQGITDIGTYLTSYAIYRGTDSTGLTEYKVVGSINTYTDTDPDAMKNKYYYRVAALLNDPCYPTGGKKAESGPYSHSMSNMEDNRLQVSSENHSPTDIILDKLTIEESQVINTLIGRFKAVDPDTMDVHTYSLVAGTGDTDNSSFLILNDSLLTGEVFDFETKNLYSIRIRATDNGVGNLVYEKSFNINVIDVIETGFEDVYKTNLKIIPNPFSESTTIVFSNAGGQSYTLYLTDLSGKVCKIVNDITSSKYVLEKSDLKEGFYFVELRGPEIYRGKIVIE